MNTIGKIHLCHPPSIISGKMLRAYKRSTNEHRRVFNSIYESLTGIGLEFYPTKCPDLRAKHPLNDLVFVKLRFQEMAGTSIELRVDSIPRSIYENTSIKPRRISCHDSQSKAIWAVYNLSSTDLIPCIEASIFAICSNRYNWGNGFLSIYD